MNTREMLDEMEFAQSALNKHSSSSSLFVEDVLICIDRRLERAADLKKEMKEGETNTFDKELRKEMKLQLLDAISYL